MIYVAARTYRCAQEIARAAGADGPRKWSWLTNDTMHRFRGTLEQRVILASCERLSSESHHMLAARAARIERVDC